MMKRIFKPFIGNKYLFKIFKLLHKIALRGMNFGGGADLHESGELYVLRYIKDELEKQNMEKPVTIFDVGANRGGYSLAVEKIFKNLGKKITIYAFEPASITFQSLAKRVANSSQITPVNMGLNNKTAEAILFSNQEASPLASLYPRNLEHLDISLGRQENVHLTTVDEFCGQRGITRIDFLKLDVEGHELSVLEGAQNMLQKRAVSYIQFEFGGTDIDSRTFLRDYFNMLKKDYQFYYILRNGLVRMLHYEEQDEIFITTNYLAILKN
jgi:FkbM family methyltransferase